MNRLVLLGLFSISAAAVELPSAQQIVTRSVAANEADFQQAPNYVWVERDAEKEHSSKSTIKTSKVYMIDGSPYYELVALNDVPLSPGEQAEQERKLRLEIAKRAHESDRERSHRVAKYQRERNRDHAMLLEMGEAFDFTLSGETQLDGRGVWVLKAVAKPGYEPKTRETKVLTGMQGTLWIDKATYQWVKVQAEVVRPVNFFGFIAKVYPGTQFTLEQEPVSDNIWLPKRFSMTVRAMALGFIDQNSSDEETYRDYRPAPKVTAGLAPAQ
jgi:hypothetical protein